MSWVTGLRIDLDVLGQNENDGGGILVNDR